MIDVKYPLRTAYYQRLHNQLIGEDFSFVPVYDGVQALGDNDSLYVLLEQQSGTATNNHEQFASHESILISVVKKDFGRVARSQVDFIADQILSLVCPNPKQNGLPNQSGIQILDVQMNDDQYQEFFLENNNAVVRRMLNFTQDIYQLGDGSTIPDQPVIYSRWVFNERLTGVIDGVNKVFTTLNNFNVNTITVLVNGLKQTPGLHYTITGSNQITFVEAPQTAVQSGNDIDDILEINYFID